MHDDHGGDNDSMVDFAESLRQQPPQHNNPWTSDDPDEGDISNFQFTPTGPGRFRVQATVTRSVSPQAMQGGFAPGSIGGFMSMLTGLAGAAAGGAPRSPGQQQGPPQGQGAGLFSGPQDQDQSAFQEAQARSQSPLGMPQVRAGRFTYHGGARLFPRDANNPQPRVEPVDEMSNVLSGLMAALGGPPGSIHAEMHRDGGAEGRFQGEHTHGMPPANPIFQLINGILGGASGGQMGDFVYSQEGLDRIVSQLMEQTATSNAPGPAARNDIDSLPRKKVTEDMLGPEHTAECSICMDEVAVGEEVTVLPCKHWFHHPCVSAWLNEHDTCPHCRKGITKQQEGNISQTPQSGAAQADPTNRMPGAFDASGSGTFNDPIVMNDDAGAQASSSSGHQASAEHDGGGSDRLRRGWFGSPQ